MKISSSYKSTRLADAVSVILSNVDKKTAPSETPVRLCNYTDVYYNSYISNSMPFMYASASSREIERFSLQKGDLVITKDSESSDDIAIPALVSEDLDNVVCGYHLAILRPDDSIALGSYLLHLFDDELIRHYFFTLSNGVTRYGLTVDAISGAMLPLPPLPEQRKIAEILGTCDEAIDAQQNLIKQKELRQKGFMQRLLTGKTRFPEFIKSNRKCENRYFEYPEEWNLFRIEELASQVSRRNTFGDMPVLSCTKYAGLVDSLKYFKKQVFAEDTSGYKVVERGEFAYATNHLEEGSIGYQDLYDRAIISPIYCVFKTQDRVNDRWLFPLLKTELFRHIFEANTNASVNRRGSIRWNEFKKIQVALPTFEEQGRIADFLAVIMRDLDLARDKLAQLKQQKKALMQQLLTVDAEIEEVLAETKEDHE